MDEDENGTQDLVALMIGAIDDLQIARTGDPKAEEEAFEALLQIRNDIATAYYA